MAQSETQILFWGTVGNPISLDEFHTFEYIEYCPSSLTNFPPSEHPHPHPEEVYEYVLKLTKKHGPRLLDCRSWKCAICGTQASKLYHLFMGDLIPPENPPPEYLPWVMVTCLPICQKGGVCEAKATRMTYRIFKYTLPDSQPCGKYCENCGTILDLRECAGCRKAS